MIQNDRASGSMVMCHCHVTLCGILCQWARHSVNTLSWCWLRHYRQKRWLTTPGWHQLLSIYFVAQDLSCRCSLMGIPHTSCPPTQPIRMPLSQTSLSLILLLPGPDQPVKSTASAMKSTYSNLDTCLSTPSEWPGAPLRIHPLGMSLASVSQDDPSMGL